MKSSKRINHILLILLLPVYSYAQLTGILTDTRDGTEYKIVKIGEQWWMAENLSAIKYNDGTDLLLITGNIEWTELKTPGYCWYNNDADTYKKTYGALYNWYAVNYKNICPAGWHVPSDSDWKSLERSVGLSLNEPDSAGIRGTIHGGLLKQADTSNWKSPNKDATNKSGFSALPGGHRNWASGEFIDNGLYGTWWSGTEADSSYAWRRTLYYNDGKIRRFTSHKRDGFSVRCVKN